MRLKEYTLGTLIISKLMLLVLGLNNDVGQTPLDVALSHWFIRGIDVAFYLVKRGCGRREDKGKLLCAACQCGRLDIVKELVEQHNLDILGEHRYMICL